MTGQRCRFRRDALHQTAISANGVDVVVEDLEAGSVEMVGEPRLPDRHADARGNALPQWACRGFDARSPRIPLGVGRLAAVELAKATDIVERYRRLSQSFVFGIHSTSAAEMERRP